MRRNFLLAGTMTLLLGLTALVPVALADGDAEEIRDDRRAIREDKRELREDKRELRDDLGELFLKRFRGGNTSLDLSGSGIGRDNATYSFTINATGKGLHRMMERDGDFRVFRGAMLAHIVIYDENGTVVKDGDIRLKLSARHVGDGEWKWQVHSWGKRADGMPRLVLRGDAEKVEPGLFELGGKGHMTFKLDGEERSTPIKVTEVSGTFTRELPPPAPAAA